MGLSQCVCARAHCRVGQPHCRAQTYGFLSVFNSNQKHLLHMVKGCVDLQHLCDEVQLFTVLLRQSSSSHLIA